MASEYDDPGLDSPLVGGDRHWDAVQDLDRFLTDLYQYYYEGGYRDVCCNIVVHLLSLTFTLVFSFIAFFHVNWNGILACSGEACGHVPVFVPFDWNMSPFRGLVLCCFVAFGGYWILNIHYAYQRVRGAAEIRAFFHEKLGIRRDTTLQAMTWHQVVARVVRQQEVAAFCIVQDRLTSLEIANIIMREDNWLIAFTNLGLLTDTLPWYIPVRIVYTRAVLWVIRWLVFGWMYDMRSRIRRDFLDQPDQLAKRFRWAGIVNLLLLFPILLFVVIYYVMRHAEEFRSQSTIADARQWTKYAKWSFRGFNELPHQFEQRLAAGLVEVEKYAQMSMGHSTLLSSVKRAVKYIVGAILAGLLAIALSDDTKLFHLEIYGKTLWWYLPALGFLFAVTSGHNTAREPCYPVEEYMRLMRLAMYTHHFPPSWRAVTNATVQHPLEAAEMYPILRRRFISDHFCHRVQILFEDLLGVLLGPLLLIFHFPSTAHRLTAFVANAAYSSEALGDWCVYGCLDPSEHGREDFGAAVGERCNWTAPTVGGKLEKSTLNFLLTSRMPYSSAVDPEGMEGGLARSVSGCPAGAHELLGVVEAFAQDEIAKDPEVWPIDLSTPLRLSASIQAEPAVPSEPGLVDERLQGGPMRSDAWGPHFFWLDRLHEAYTKRRTTERFAVEPPPESCAVQ